MLSYQGFLMADAVVRLEALLSGRERGHGMFARFDVPDLNSLRQTVRTRADSWLIEVDARKIES